MTLIVISYTAFTQNAEIIKIQQLPSKYVRITLESNLAFIIGARDYHLYIDEILFTNSKISNEGAKNYIQFLISEESYGALPNSAELRLTYGKSKPVERSQSSSNRNVLSVNNLFDKSLKRN